MICWFCAKLPSRFRGTVAKNGLLLRSNEETPVIYYIPLAWRLNLSSLTAARILPGRFRLRAQSSRDTKAMMGVFMARVA